ncbi:MAG: hypothetical protein HY360_26095 [Verrucomicrobia bacterium]|nr:hypothetical protein [Verrucomicrobiota bacterium]
MSTRPLRTFLQQRAFWVALARLGIVVFCVITGSGCTKPPSPDSRDGMARTAPPRDRPVDVTLPNPSFDPAKDMSDWELADGVTLNADRGAREKGALRFSLSPQRSSVSARLKKPLAIPGWHWHRLTFSYRLTPGASATVSWLETDQDGIVHPRHCRNYPAVALAPAAEFTTVSLDFISWPNATQFALVFNAALANGFEGDAEVLLDDLRLQTMRPAPTQRPRRLERAVPNHSFESQNIFGYQNPFEGASLSIVEGTDVAAIAGQAFHGRRYLRHHPGPSGKGVCHYYLPVREDVALEPGRLYRISLQARGNGAVSLGINAVTAWAGQGANLFDVPHYDRARVFPLTTNDWREVRASYIIDRQPIREFRVVMFLDGMVEADDVQIDQMR